MGYGGGGRGGLQYLNYNLFLVLIAKFTYGLWQKADLAMLKTGQNETAYRGHIYIDLELSVNDGWGKERDAEAFAFPLVPRSPPARGSAVRHETGSEGEGRVSSEDGPGRARAGRPAIAVPLPVGAERERGRWRSLASCQRLLRSFTPTLLPPTPPPRAPF